jgi:hypothetical protein
MTTMITELYNALRKAGVPDEDAEAAAKAVLPAEQAATKDDLRVVIAELETRLTHTLWLQAGVIIGALSFIGGGIATLIKAL